MTKKQAEQLASKIDSTWRNRTTDYFAMGISEDSEHHRYGVAIQDMQTMSFHAIVWSVEEWQQIARK